MSGTKTGGLKAAQKNLANNPNFYVELGRKGGKVGTTGGFASATKEQVRAWGAKGGSISRRTKKPIDSK